MNQHIIIQKSIKFVKEILSQAEGGHDWWHIYRVWSLAKHIAKHENVNLFVVELGALLHDIADSKFNDGDETLGPRKDRQDFCLSGLIFGCYEILILVKFLLTKENLILIQLQ